ncbi:toprim domain-containing protein [Staphylococcus gallinarum]|uniref:toprim domain-containing protein n=1 Tax=Staphylococcus gallinarum TaxID=1293 RepID=UPI001E40B7D7|nr:toprim domain-containing protein [Staphylococcus gallinarum]MCD8900382.1 toprim domain-containing protein [Staphylococcus gallinarum]MCD8901633.1 toprim domain-containing protein [Staphylococcus gallinarum]MCD8918052.1 toprim domain-containing protein [Staphylococcus gallinarum]MEB6237676.1 toprim domain-containing protein [Staphylococcus gallinarum]
MTILNQVIIVEGKSDKKRVKQVIDQPIEIICTNGTMGVDKLDAMIESLYGKQVHILVDSDNEGEKIRKWFKRYLSESHHIRIDKQYCEVAKCPKPYLSRVLEKNGFKVKDEERMAKAQIDYIAERVSLLT